MKLREELCELEKNSYASDHIDLPEGGVDCSEGCNPYGYPKEIEKILGEFKPSRFSLYPHSMAAYNGICNFWKEQCELKKENIMLTDGSISALYIINNIFSVKGAKVLGIAPQFSDFTANVKLLGMDYYPVFLKEEDNYQMSAKALLEQLTDEISMVYIDNPNNPTGQVLNSQEIESILKKAKECDVCVIVDEAYGDFMPKENSAVRFLKDYENLIVVRTLSKGFGLAGVRVGYILASELLIRYMSKVTNPYQVGEFSRELTGAALTVGNHIKEHMEYFAKQKKELREMIGKNLRMAETCDTVPICLFYHKNPQTDLYRLFMEHGILAVPGAEFEGIGPSCVRLRMPRMEEFEALKKAVQEIDEAEV